MAKPGTVDVVAIELFEVEELAPESVVEEEAFPGPRMEMAVKDKIDFTTLQIESGRLSPRPKANSANTGTLISEGAANDFQTTTV